MCSAALDPGNRGRVLLVEDVNAMRLYLRLTLERDGFEVAEAASLYDARRYLRAGHRPTSVLLDLELPDGHGLDILRELPSGVPVVALSADESSETTLRCRQAGCVAVLSKNRKLGELGRVMAGIQGHSVAASSVPRQDAELARQYNTFLAEVRVDLQRASERRDFDGVRRIAHRLRGTAVHFGYIGIGTSAHSVGRAIASGDVDRIESALEGLIEQLLDAADSRCTG